MSARGDYPLLAWLEGSAPWPEGHSAGQDPSIAESITGVLDQIRALRLPHLTMQRIVDGLNGDHGVEQPALTWSIGPERTTPGSFPMLHNGAVVGEIVWHTMPADPPKWHARMLAGLNYTATRADPYPEPLPTGRHLRAVS